MSSEVNIQLLSSDSIKSKICTFRGVQVMIDSDIAELYGVEPRVLNQAVKRNSGRFPTHFRFQLTKEEYSEYQHFLTSQFVILKDKSPLKSQIVSTSQSTRGQHRKYLPYVFTEQGVSMLSAVLKSETAIQVSIQIIDAFVAMRRSILHNAEIFTRLDSVDRKQLAFEQKVEQKFEKVFQALETNELPKQGIFYNGQIFDAYTFASELIRSAKKSLVLIDNYIDDSVLTLFSKRKKSVSADLYTKTISKQFELDLKKHNAQYPAITVHRFAQAHDRFLIIDDVQLYHIGASLKDLGKKWFAFSKMEIGAVEVLSKLRKKP